MISEKNGNFENVGYIYRVKIFYRCFIANISRYKTFNLQNVLCWKGLEYVSIITWSRPGPFQGKSTFYFITNVYNKKSRALYTSILPVTEHDEGKGCNLRIVVNSFGSAITSSVENKPGVFNIQITLPQSLDPQKKVATQTANRRLY